MPESRPLELDDRELIRRITSKDADALDSFYSRYNRLAFTLVLGIVGNREDAEDVLVDVFWQVWQQASRYDAERGKAAAWLLTIARSRAIDHLRAHGSRTEQTDRLENPPSTAGSSAESDIFVLADTRQAVHEALQSLPETQRIPLEMAYFQGMSQSEIAEALEQPLGTVKDRVRNGMMHLRRRLKPYL